MMDGWEKHNERWRVINHQREAQVRTREVLWQHMQRPPSFAVEGQKTSLWNRPRT